VIFDTYTYADRFAQFMPIASLPCKPLSWLKVYIPNPAQFRLNARNSMRSQSVIVNSTPSARNKADMALKGFKFSSSSRTADLRSTHPIEVQRQIVVETDGSPVRSPIPFRNSHPYSFTDDWDKAPSLTMTV
jgi:hypothetical protein